MATNLARLFGLVDKSSSPTGCWLWRGCQWKGYGRYAGRPAHRVTREVLVGPTSDDLELDHTCLNTLCVNPDHLEPVTRLENIRRRYALQTHCKHGHEFTPENTRVRDRRRYCRACDRRRTSAYKARRVGVAA